MKAKSERGMCGVRPENPVGQNNFETVQTGTGRCKRYSSNSINKTLKTDESDTAVTGLMRR